MSATLTFPIVPQLSGWSLAGTLRNILDANGNPVRIELAPQSVLTDAEFDTAQSWSSGGTLGSWTLLNTGNITTLDENTSQKSCLYVKAAAGEWVDATQTAPYAYQLVTGDFDVFFAPRSQSTDYGICGLAACDNAAPGTYVNLFTGDGNGPYDFLYSNQSGNMTMGRLASVLAASVLAQGAQWLFRLKRASGVFSAYVGVDSKNWTQLTNPSSQPTISGTVRLGFTGRPVNAAAYWSVDFIRNTNPYDTTSPSASVVLDSGVNGTAWALSTFQDYLNEYKEFAPYSQIGFGTLKYQYGASDSNPPSLNGTWLTTASMQGQSNATGRYLKLAVQFNSAHGYELASFCGATIQGTISSGGVIVVEDD